jgi:hypothetical protein
MLTRLLCALVFLLTASLGLRVEDRSTADLLTEILNKRDACNVRDVFQKLGKRADEEAFEAITQGIEVLVEGTNRFNAISSLSHFTEADDKLKSRVVKYVNEGLNDPAIKDKFTLAIVLADFGAFAEKELLHQLDRGFTSLTRAKLLRGVLPVVVEEGGARNLERVLLHFAVNLTGKEEELKAALEKLYEASRARTTVKVLDRPSPLLSNTKDIVKAFGELSGKPVDSLLSKLAVASNSELRQFAVEALILREGKAATKLLQERFKKEEDPGAQGKALTGLLARPDTAGKASKAMKRAAKSKSDTDREMVATALGNAGIGDIELLLPLLSDKAKRVRQVALAACLQRREKAAIASLIERLDAEEDTTLIDVHEALRKLTGQDFGARPHRWRTWWGQEGETFELPSTRDARNETKTRDMEKMRRDRGSQYGLNPKGEGTYFLLDVSDSMKMIFELAKNKEGRMETTYHIDILGEELVGVVERMKDGQMFNVIRFGSSVEKLAPALTALTEETRASASEFVQRKETLGATALSDALEAAFEDRGMDTIYVITDGAPKGGKIDDPDKLLSQVKKWNRRRKAKIHCIDLQRIESGFLKSLAEQSGGESHHVPPPL